MKEKSIPAVLRSCFVLLPVLSLGLCAAEDSVRVYESGVGLTQSGSYFALLDIGAMAILPPAAAILTAVCLVCGGLYLWKRRAGVLKVIRYAALLAALAAAAPILNRSTQTVIPNVGVPIYMLLLTVLCRWERKKETDN